jgi:serine phosphatase RsbU (regulator of sigma subunit)
VVDLAAFCEPAAFAGGDFFDWFTAADGRIILCLGDVTGHGVGPALLAAECRAYSRVLLHQLPLGEAMVRLNELMLADLEEGRFVTFVAVAIDQQTRVAEVSSAGQGPLLLRRADGGIMELDVQHAPLGIGPLEPVAPVRIELGTGDTVVLVSDGVYEATSASEEGRFGTARLLESLGKSVGQTAAATVSQLITAVTGFAAGQAAEDDVTVLVARAV